MKFARNIPSRHPITKALAITSAVCYVFRDFTNRVTRTGTRQRAKLTLEKRHLRYDLTTGAEEALSKAMISTLSLKDYFIYILKCDSLI